MERWPPYDLYTATLLAEGLAGFIQCSRHCLGQSSRLDPRLGRRFVDYERDTSLFQYSRTKPFGKSRGLALVQRLFGFRTRLSQNHGLLALGKVPTADVHRQGDQSESCLKSLQSKVPCIRIYLALKVQKNGQDSDRNSYLVVHSESTGIDSTSYLLVHSESTGVGSISYLVVHSSPQPERFYMPLTGTIRPTSHIVAGRTLISSPG